MISNSIQAYQGKTNQTIDLIVEESDNKLYISVKDYGCGLPKKVKDKLFKEMITTKGKNGTGLGLYMSYSTIKAHFGGDITFESEPGKRYHFYYNITFIVFIENLLFIKSFKKKILLKLLIFLFFINIM